MGQITTESAGASTDQYSAPLFIAWQLNAACNLKCLHCCEDAGTEFPDRLTREQMLDACRQFVEAQVPYVALSGGEPLLCPHFWDVCEFLRGHRVSVKVETNGEMIDAEVARRMGRLRFRSIQISIDGASSQAHEALRENGDWSKVIRACELLRSEGVNTEVVFVPTRFNIHETADAVDLVASLGAAGFYTGKLMRIGRAATNWEKLCPSAQQYEQFFATLKQKTEEYAGRMKVYFYPYDVIEELRYRLETPAASLLILPNGKVKLIGPLPFICGDLKVMPLSEIWDRYKRAWKDPRVIAFGRDVVADPTLVARANELVEL